MESKYQAALPYLSLLPLTEQCLDLTVADMLHQGFSHSILDYLLDAEATTTIDLDTTVNKKDKERYPLAQAIQKSLQVYSEASQTLSIGFPLLIKEDEALDKPIAAPLFVWEVSLTRQENQWHFTKKDVGKVNPLLKDYLQTQWGFDWEKEVGLLPTIDAANLEMVQQKLAEALSISFDGNEPIVACPSVEESLEEGLCASLIIGHLLPSNTATDKPMPQALQTRPDKQWLTKIGALPSDSAQDELIGRLFEGNHLVVEGIAGAGKTHTIASILPAALVDAASVLIVADNASQKDIIYHLEKLGLQSKAVQLVQEDLDKLKLLKQLGNLPKAVKKISQLDSVDYTKKLDKHHRLRIQLEETYDCLHANIFTDWDWTAVVGYYLENHFQSPKQLLHRVLDPSIFVFTWAEYEILCQEIEEHATFFKPLNVLVHPLNALHGRFFESTSTLETSKTDARSAINLFKQKAKDLYYDYLAFADDYADYLYFKYDDFAQSLEKQIDKIIQDLKLYNEVYGNEFDKQSSFQNVKLRFLSMFSRKHQEIIAAKKQLLADFEKLKSSYLSKRYFDTDFPDIHQESKLADIEDKLLAFQEELLDWKKTAINNIEEHVNELSSKRKLPNVFAVRLTTLEENLQELVENIDNKQLLRQAIEFEEKEVLPNRQQTVNKIILQLKKLTNYWQDFDAYFNWRKHWLSLSKETQKTVQALVKTHSDDWLASFRSWYFYQLLKVAYQHQQPTSEFEAAQPFETYLQNLSAVQEHITKKAIRITKERQLAQIRRLRKEKDITPTNAQPFLKNKSLKVVLEWLGLPHLGEFFPIFLVSPTLAVQLFEYKKPYFDLVILDNAASISEEKGHRILKLGNQRIVLGRPLEQDDQSSILHWILNQKGRNYQYLEQSHSKSDTPNERLTTTAAAPNPLQQAIAKHIKPYLPHANLQVNQSIDGVIVDILIESTNKKPLAILCDLGLAHQGKFDFQLAVNRIHILQKKGYLIKYIWSVEWWKNTEKALQPLLASLLEWAED